MPAEIIFTVGKALWFLLTAGVSWLLTQLWGDYKEFKKDATSKYNELNQKFVKLEAMAVTQNKLDESWQCFYDDMVIGFRGLEINPIIL